MMERLIYIGQCCIFLVLMLTGGCTYTDDAVWQQGEAVSVDFRPKLDAGLDSRAIADGTSINELVVVVFDEGKKVLEEVEVWEKAQREGILLRLVKGHEYQVLFWAQNSGNTAYSIGADGTVSVNYDDYLNGGFTKMEELDVFYAVDNVTVSPSAGSRQIKLSRPLAQLNFADNACKPLDGHQAEVTLENVATSFNVLTGKVNVDGKKTFTFTDFPDETLSSDGTDYHYVASVYLFPAQGVKAEYRLSSQGNEFQRLTFENLTLEANKRTNVLGTIVQAPESVWDGKTFTVPATDGLNRYIIDEESDLAWLQTGDNTLPAGTFMLTRDLDMGSQPLSSLKLPENSTFEGDGHTIKNLKLSGGLFGDAAALTVDGLTIDAAEIAATAHVGVLVNTLTGGGTFTRVTVSNSSVSATNGAAGGMVGYMENGATFDNCHVVSSTMSGSDAEGHFVGLMRGYTNEEVLTFGEECTASGNTLQDFESLYSEGKESAWLVDNDYTKFNGWLGREEYFRGIVNYGDLGRFVPKWDGKTKVAPLKETDDIGEYQAVYSAFDLADLQDGSHTYVKFMEDVDLGGTPRENEYEDEDKGGNAFSPITHIKRLEGNDKTIHNLYIEVKDRMGGFIKNAASHTHRNLTFEKSTVIVHPVPSSDNSEEHGYAGTLTPYVEENYTVENIRVNNGLVFGLGKIGGLIGFVTRYTNLHCSSCYVTDSTVKNDEGTIQEVFQKTAAGATVTAKFYAHGEAGGLIGMVMGNSTIADCHVTHSTMDCYGEENQTQIVTVKLGFISIPVWVTIQGRHVNNFIGNIRTPEGQAITITSCSATDNNYITEDGKRKDDPITVNGNTTNLIGLPYYLNLYNMIEIDTKGSVKVDGKDFL